MIRLLLVNTCGHTVLMSKSDVTAMQRQKLLAENRNVPLSLQSEKAEVYPKSM